MYSIIIINLFSLVFNPHWTEHIYIIDIEAFVLNSPLQLRTLPDALYYVVRAGPPPITITRLKKD